MTPRQDAGPAISGFFDPATNSISYLVVDPESKAAAIIDAVLDFEAPSARVSTRSADAIIATAAGLRVDWILETHTHADHLSAAAYLKSKLGGAIGIGAEVTWVQRMWKEIYNLDSDFTTDGSQFDRLFKDGDTFNIGRLSCAVWHTPGHTPACIAYIVAGPTGPKCVFVGDTVFMPDYGTARCDFPGGDAHVLYRSIRRILSLPPETRIFVGHDYLPNGRAVAWETTVAEQRRANLHVKDGTSEEQFVAFRQARDKTLAAPTLILPAVQINIRGGRLPPPEPNGTVYLKLPINRL
jgi:glyoxylase-like metal-dependent hydrolase (beta-lactamase superfamily II)